MMTSVNREASRSKYWQLDGMQATLRSGGVSGMVDLHWPTRGLSALTVEGEAIVGSLLGVGVEPAAGIAESGDTPWQPADFYLRGCDLVALYREPLEEPYNVQVYWRVVEGMNEERLTLDAIVSIHTPLWEAHPCVTVRSELFGRELETVGDALLLRSDGEWSYVEVTRPGDFTLPHATAPASGLAAVHWRFGRSFMEKGVIRRLQIRGSFVLNDNLEEAPDRLEKALSAEQPSLTA